MELTSKIRIIVALAIASLALTVSDCSKSTGTTVLPSEAASLRSSSQSYRILYNFGVSPNGDDGAAPAANVTADGSALYGTTEYGGAYGFGKYLVSGTVF